MSFTLSRIFPVSERLSPKRMIRLKVGSGVAVALGEGVGVGVAVAVAVAVAVGVTVGVGVGCPKEDKLALKITATAVRRFEM
jgi:hypothetical protein